MIIKPALNRRPQAESNRKMAIVEPKNIRFLIDSCGMTPSEVAKKIGVSSGVITTSLALNEVRQAYDMAACLIIEQETHPPKNTKTDTLSTFQILQMLKDQFKNKTIFNITPEEIALLDQPLKDLLRNLP